MASVRHGATVNHADSNALSGRVVGLAPRRNELADLPPRSPVRVGRSALRCPAAGRSHCAQHRSGRLEHGVVLDVGGQHPRAAPPTPEPRGASSRASSPWVVGLRHRTCAAVRGLVLGELPVLVQSERFAPARGTDLFAQWPTAGAPVSPESTVRSIPSGPRPLAYFLFPIGEHAGDIRGVVLWQRFVLVHPHAQAAQITVRHLRPPVRLGVMRQVVRRYGGATGRGTAVTADERLSRSKTSDDGVAETSVPSDCET